jgi:SAM-dependent methyltransferase
MSEQMRLFEQTACAVCGTSASADRIGAVCDHEYPQTGDRLFPVLQCPGCGLVFLSPRPAVESLPLIYPRNYYAFLPDDGRGVLPWYQRLSQQFHVGALRRRLAPLMARFAADRPLRVMDVGCGSGRTLELLRELWPLMEGHGVDMSATVESQLARKGFIGHAGNWEQLDLPPGHFDLLVSSDVIEHVADPMAFLRQCARVLRSGGCGYLETPDTGGLSFDWLKSRHWGGYHAPRHWHLFNHAALAQALSGAGLDIQQQGNYLNPLIPMLSIHSLLFRYGSSALADAFFNPSSARYNTPYNAGLEALMLLLQSLPFRLTRRSSAQWVLFERP